MTNNETVSQLATSLGVSEKDIVACLKREQYRMEYNKRPAVVERRKAYNRQRNQKLSLIKQLIAAR